MAIKNYYDILGVPRNASSDEIRAAFRKIALENHEDKLKGLPENEVNRRKEVFLNANDAYRVLSDTKKRAQYDRAGFVDIDINREGGLGHQYAYEDLVSSLFGENGLFGSKSLFGFESAAMFSTQSQPKVPKEIILPENDWGLLAGLIKAYKSEGDGKWDINISPEDKRDWMPQVLYRIRRDKGDVQVLRKITDWRFKDKRDKPIQRAQKDRKWMADDSKELKPNTFLGEYYLAGKGSDDLYSEPITIPYTYGKYLTAVKSLAKKIASNPEGVPINQLAKELDEINSFSEYKANNVRVEGSSLWADDTDREWVRKTPLDGFSKRLGKAYTQVDQIEGQQNTKEGQSPQGHGEQKS